MCVDCIELSLTSGIISHVVSCKCFLGAWMNHQMLRFVIGNFLVTHLSQQHDYPYFLLFILHSFTRRPLGAGGFLQLTVWMVRLGLLAVFICNVLASVKSPEACTNLLEDAVPALGNFHSSSRATGCGKAHKQSYENKDKVNHISHGFPEVCRCSKIHRY